MSFLKNLFGRKEKSTDSYEAFWSWFVENEKSFFKVVKEQGNISEAFFNKMSPKLEEIKEGFYFLTGMPDENTVELIFTPDGVIRNIVFVEELVEAAPKINGWKFVALKPAMDINNLGIKMGDYTFDSDSLSFYSKNHDFMPDEIDIIVAHKNFKEEDKAAITNGIYIFMDNYLGELNSVTNIDNMTVIGIEEAEEELIPISKLKDFLIWRQKEFIEKYDGIRYNTEKDEYASLEATLKNGNPLIAVVNTTLLKWDSKASHPWVMHIEIPYDGQRNNGFPEAEMFKFLNDVEEEMMKDLKDSEGYLNIGRQTADNAREIYLACKDFRLPSKVVYKIQNQYKDKIDLEYSIYKDKYWQSLDRFRVN